MRIIRVATVALLSLGLTLSPVAAGMVPAHMAKCEQMMSIDHDDCGCCGEAACPPSACVVMCFGVQVGLAYELRLSPSLGEIFYAYSSVTLSSLGYSPEPPPPRA